MSSKRFYELSRAADQDIEEIFDYSSAKFGSDQAMEYVAAFEPLFKELVANPELGRARDEIRTGLRSMPKASHVVFYRILADRIRIVRVLHGSRDIPNFLQGV